MMTHYPKLGESLFQKTLSNGLTVAVVPRKGFQRKLAYFVTDFGAIHTEFSYNGKDYQVPAGVAHFLEHKMFELPNRDIMGEFSALGANVNAFTSYDMTAYYFSCTEHFEKNLRLLIEFVSTPYFEKESVQREMGIIDQEIGMNLDSPDSRIFEDLMTAMFTHHPIRVPILGNSESIRQITPEILHLCHKAFYTPKNMILCVVGDVCGDEICAMAEEVLGVESRPVGIKKAFLPEDMSVNAAPARQMVVSMPMFQLGFKCETEEKGEKCVYQEVVGDLAAEALFGESSKWYLQQYEQGLIDSSFGGGFETVDGCAMLTCGGDSESPEKILPSLLAQAEHLLKTGISEADFLRMKRSALGRRIRDLDSFDSTAFRICAYRMDEYDYFRFPEIYETVTAEDVLAFIRQVVQPERCAVSIITPQST